MRANPIPNLRINNVLSKAEHTPSAYLVPPSFHINHSRRSLAVHTTAPLVFDSTRSLDLTVSAMARITRAAKHLTHQCTPRPLLPVLVALCFVTLSLPSPVSSQSAADSCSNALSLGSLVPFNTTGLTCFQAWPSKDFILRVSLAFVSGSID